MELTSLLEFVLPAVLLTHFEITSLSEGSAELPYKSTLIICLDEKNELHSYPNPEQYESKGFYAPKRIKDFPLRNRLVELRIRRRYWREKSNKNNTITNDYSLMADNTKMTKELSDFLKYSDKHK